MCNCSPGYGASRSAGSEISFLANLGTQALPQALTVLSATGQPSVEVLPVAGRRLQPVFTNDIDTTSLVEGVLRLVDARGDLTVTRFPRPVVPFRYDDLINGYVECERVRLARIRCCWSRMPATCRIQ